MNRDVFYRDHMGSDLGVVNDARISFAASSDAEDWRKVEIPHPCHSAARFDTKVPTLSKGDKRLIGFLARGCRSGQWEEALEQVCSGDLSKDEAHELLSWAKRLPPHWTPFGQQTVKLRMKAPVPNRTQC